MAAVSVLGPGGYPKAPYGSFAGKIAATGGSKVYTQTFSVLGPGGYPRPPYGSFAGKTPFIPPTTPTYFGQRHKIMRVLSQGQQ